MKPSIYDRYYLNNSNPVELISGVRNEILNKTDVKMVMIVYYGAIDAGIDLVDVILCFIFKLPCQNNKSFLTEDGEKGKQNPSIDLKKYQIMHILSNFVRSKNCNIDLEKIIDQYAYSYNWKLPLPTIEYDLSFYKNLSLAQDAFVRDHFSMLFGNKKANENVVKDFKYSEIDQKAVKESSEWKKELKNAVEYFQHFKLITC